MIRRPPRSTLFPYTNALPIYSGTRLVRERGARSGRADGVGAARGPRGRGADRKSTRLNSSHTVISYAVFCLKKKKKKKNDTLSTKQKSKMKTNNRDNEQKR